jgi:uncharacterized protein YceK
MCGRSLKTWCVNMLAIVDMTSPAVLMTGGHHHP